MIHRYMVIDDTMLGRRTRYSERYAAREDAESAAELAPLERLYVVKVLDIISTNTEVILTDLDNLV